MKNPFEVQLLDRKYVLLKHGKKEDLSPGEKSKFKIEKNFLLKIRKNDNLKTEANPKQKIEEKVQLKNEDKSNLQLEENKKIKASIFQNEENKKLATKLKKREYRLTDIKYKTKIETKEKYRLEKEKKTKIKPEKKITFKNIKNSYKMNQISIKIAIINIAINPIINMIKNQTSKDSILRIKDKFISKFSFSPCFITFLFLLILCLWYYEGKHIIRKDINFNKTILIEKGNNNKNRKNNNIIRNIILFRNLIIIYLIIIISVLQLLSPKNKVDIIQLKFSNITLKINGIGSSKKVFNSNTGEFNTIYYPNIIYINGEKKDTINYQYNFNQTDNIVELIWNNTINYTRLMFQGCSDITAIDLFHFDS